ncbi:hypothetical protein D3C87_1592970 [compost metagenome]
MARSAQRLGGVLDCEIGSQAQALGPRCMLVIVVELAGSVMTLGPGSKLPGAFAARMPGSCCWRVVDPEACGPGTPAQIEILEVKEEVRVEARDRLPCRSPDQAASPRDPVHCSCRGGVDRARRMGPGASPFRAEGRIVAPREFDGAFGIVDGGPHHPDLGRSGELGA